MALGIFLTVLKVIGKVLLWILVILLALILLILFLPITYNVKLDYEEGNFEVLGRTGWYFLLVNFPFEFRDKKFRYKLRVFGIPIFSSDKKTVKKPEGKKKVKKGKKENSTNKKSKHTNTDGTGKTTKEVHSDSGSKKSKGDRLKDILRDDHIGELVSVILDALGRLLKLVLPKKMEGTIEFGTGDPYTEGKILGCISMFYGLYADKLTIVPEWEEKKFTAHVRMKGHFTVFALVIIAIRLFRNRYFMKLIKNITKK